MAAKSERPSSKKSESSIKKLPESAKPSEKASSTTTTGTKVPPIKAVSAKGSAKDDRTASVAAPVGSNRHVYVPVKKDTAKSDVKAWVGRTKKQVDEDNMRIAKAEDAYKGCKVQPIGVSDQQFFWVVDADGTNTLRTFGDIKGLRGEWQPDPRFPRAWFFQRESEGKK